MSTDERISFGSRNSGQQVAINYGTMNNYAGEARMGMLEKLSFARGAEFDSYTNQHEDRCLPGTRKELLKEIAEWTVSPQEGKCIFWLNGVAGTGKSTVSRTVAKRLKDENSLAASFFFKRGEGDRGNATRFFATIAKQLARKIHGLSPLVEQAIQKDPEIENKSLVNQFEELILHPLSDLEACTSSTNMVIVIDALDECEKDMDIRLILQLLPRLQALETIRLRTFLTSRPELPIRMGFKKIAAQDHKTVLLHEIAKGVIESDIALFLNHRISEIRDDREPPLPSDWPGADNLHKLVELSIPLFIFAATICRIFEDPYWDPVDSLPQILAHKNDKSQFDGTYLPVLHRLFVGQTDVQKEVLVQEFHRVIGAIVLLETSLPVVALSRLIGCSERLIHLRLSPLHSVLNIPKDDASTIKLFHLSFREFLLDPKTREKTPLGLDEGKVHNELTRRCLAVCRSLKRNICGLKDATERAGISSRLIEQCLPLELQYSCRYWAHHLVHSQDVAILMNEAFSFLQVHLLHWMEAMCLLGLITEVQGTLTRLSEVAFRLIDEPPGFSDFLHEAKMFLRKNCHIVNLVPLQIYCAGMILAPQESLVRKMFEKDLPDWIYLLPQGDEDWSAELMSLNSLTKPTVTISFSPDGQLLACGSTDGTVRIWRTDTGILQQTLTGPWSKYRHEKRGASLSSVRFLTDGRLLASGSFDKRTWLWDFGKDIPNQMVVRHPENNCQSTLSSDGAWLAAYAGKTLLVWDTVAGTLYRALQFQSPIKAVAFSHDSRLLAVAAFPIHLWHIASGEFQTIPDSGMANSTTMTFSPNNQLLASRSAPNIWIWELKTMPSKHLVLELSAMVISMDFSPDSRLLAAGYYDSAIRIWDTTTGVALYTLGARSLAANSVTFSPDGRLLAFSRSGDVMDYDWNLNYEIVRLWDISTDVAPLTDSILPDRVIYCSSDGKKVVSGNSKGDVRLWDATSGLLQRDLPWNVLGDGVHPLVLAFSPDSQLLATSFYGNDLGVFDTRTGLLQHTSHYGNHSETVTTLAFSHCGQLLASGSDDCTVNLMELESGHLIKSFRGPSDSIKSVSFSTDDLLIACTSKDNILRIWEIKTGTLQMTLKDNFGLNPSLVVFSPNSKSIAFVVLDTKVVLQNIKTGAMHQSSFFRRKITSLEFSQDGKSLRTNLGVLPITPKADIATPPSHPPPPQIDKGLFIEKEEWITLHGERVLWLPPGHRTQCYVIKDDMVALAQESGRMDIMRFRL